MTFTQAYTSLKTLYKKLIFPSNPYAKKWSMAELDSMDLHFFNELMTTEEEVQMSYIDQVM